MIILNRHSLIALVIILKITGKLYKVMTFCLKYHCLCTRVFVIILMFEEPQTGVDLSTILYIQKKKEEEKVQM